jgi:hypothetical protein
MPPANPAPDPLDPAPEHPTNGALLGDGLRPRAPLDSSSSSRWAGSPHPAGSPSRRRSRSERRAPRASDRAVSSSGVTAPPRVVADVAQQLEVPGSDAGRRPHTLGDRVVEPRLHPDEVGERGRA